MGKMIQRVKLSRIKDLLCDDREGQKEKWIQNFDKRVSDVTEFDSELLTWDLPRVQWLRLHLPMQGGSSSITGWGAKIPHASWPKNRTENRKKYCNKFNNDFKKGPHQKKKKKRKKEKSVNAKN